MKTQTTTTPAQFKEGEIYLMSFIGDSDLKPPYKCIKRTAKTVTMSCCRSGEKLNRRIKTNYEGTEYVVDGSYSMAPAIYAARQPK